MAAKLPNGAIMSIASGYALAIAVTAISNAAVAVASAEGHGLQAGQIVKLVSGWSAINGRAAKVGEVTADTFQLLGFDTTDEQRFPTGGGAGSVRLVTGWQQIQQVMNPSTSGGEQQFTQYQFLEDDDQRQLPTIRSAQSIAIPIADDVNLPHWPVIEAADRRRELEVCRLVLRDRSEIYYNGYISVSDTPTLTVNEIMARTMTIALDGRPTRYKAAA